MSRYVARLMAPLAIAVVAFGIYFVVHDNLATHHRSRVSHAIGQRHRRHHHHAHGATSAKPMFYTVKSGDTLSAIASHVGVPIVRLESLNPKVNPNSLQSGERLRLRR